MYKINLEVEGETGVQAKFMQNDTVVIVRASAASPTSLPEAQPGLLLDFNIRDTFQNQKKWGALEHSLQQIFNRVVVTNSMPGCQAKVNIFILMEGSQAEPAIINACWVCFLRLGLPMTRSIWAMGEEGNNTLVVNLHGNHEVIDGKYVKGLTEEHYMKMKNFESVVRESFKNCLC